MNHVTEPPAATAYPGSLALRPLARRSLSIARFRFPLISAATVLVVLVLWTAITNLLPVSEMVLPSPQTIIEHFRTLLTDGYGGEPLWNHIVASLLRTLTGFFLGIGVAIPLGLWVGYSPTMNAICMPMLGFIRPIPPIAFIPLVILWFGIGEVSKILLIFAASFNFTVLASAAGMRAVPEQLIRAGVNLGLNKRQLFTSVMLPAAMPHIFTGIKTSIAVSWAVVVAAELIAAQSGLGFMIEDAGTFFRTPEVLIGVSLIGAIGLLFEVIVSLLERRVLHWQTKG